MFFTSDELVIHFLGRALIRRIELFDVPEAWKPRCDLEETSPQRRFYTTQ